MKELLKISLIVIGFLIAISACKKEVKLTPKIKSSIDIFQKVQSDSFTIFTDKDTVIMYKTGTKIKIPKDAFVDSAGNVIKGKVCIAYREFRNSLDILKSNIPMLYDTLDNSYLFESAGMLEFNAYTQNKKVFPNKKNPIQLSLLSKTTDSDFNLYSLDTKTNKWTYIGKNEVKIRKYKDELEDLPKVPVAPKRATSEAFSIGDMNGQCPELSMYNNVYFIPVNGVYTGFTASDIKVRNKGNGIFELHFIMEAYGVKIEKNYDCYLAFQDGIDYSNAMKIYQSKYKNLITRYNLSLNKLKQEWEIYDSLIVDFNKKKEIVNRVFNLTQFGIINCDRFLNSNRKLVPFSVTVESSIPLKVSLLFKNINSVFSSDLLISPKQGSIINNVYTFNNMPIGEPITIIVCGTENKNAYFEIKDGIISENGIHIAKPKKMTVSEIKTQINSLNIYK